MKKLLLVLLLPFLLGFQTYRINAFGIEFTPRQGKFGPQDWRTNVKKEGESIVLDAHYGGGYRANSGLTIEKEQGYCTAIFTIECLPTDPHLGWAVWARDVNPNRKEEGEVTFEDFPLEPNKAREVWLTRFDGEDKPHKKVFTRRSYYRHRITIGYYSKSQWIHVEGWRDSDKRWVSCHFAKWDMPASDTWTFRVGLIVSDKKPNNPPEYRGSSTLRIVDVQFK